MEIIKIVRKGRHLNILEKHHISCAQQQNKQLNDIDTDSHNLIFDTLHNHDYQ
jgi:hypothetical protein